VAWSVTFFGNHLLNGARHILGSAGNGHNGRHRSIIWDGCERILRDEFKDYPEGALYMIGAIDEAKKKAPPDKPAAKTKPEFKLEVQTEIAAKPKPESEEKS
jgi:hypothetical protein